MHEHPTQRQHHDDQHAEPQATVNAVEVEQVTTSKYVSEQDLAMYAAITGRRPVVEIVRQRPGVSIGYVASDVPKGLRGLLATARSRKRVSVWIRSVSVEARKKFDEAKMRLAS